MNRVALVTGASRGIGRGIAVALAELGFDLGINYVRQETAAHETAAECLSAASHKGRKIRVEILKADISLPKDRARLLEQMEVFFGRMDLLVNNAGVAPETRADLLEATEESFDRVLGINLKGPYFLSQASARWMLEQKNRLGPGYRPNIVFIGSISAATPSVNRGDYCIAKSGLSMVSRLFAARLAESGIGVFEIRPGIMATDMTEPVRARYDSLIANGLTPIRRWGTPGDVGKAVAAIAQDLFPFSTGGVFDVDGGFHLHPL